jgi:hypothetical protein
VLLELGHDHLCGFSGDIESDTDRTTRRRENGGIHADDTAFHVEGRSARIAFIDGRIDLDVVVVRTGPDIAAVRRHDAGRHCATKTKRIPDGDNPVADTRFAVGELHEGKALVGFNLDERQVGLRIGADNFRLVDGSVIGRNLDGLRAIDDMIVRHGIAIR